MIDGFTDSEAYKAGLLKEVKRYPGFVKDVNDPLGLHRVRVHIPGYMDLTPWAFPEIAGGGAARGGHIVPEAGCPVFVTFLYGDDERPIYSGCGWGTPNVPADIKAAGKEAHLIQALEISKLGDLSFRVTIDERPGKRAVKLYAIDVTDNEVIASLEFDLEKRGLSLFGLAGVDIQGRGFVNVDAAQVQIHDRLVLEKAGPI